MGSNRDRGIDLLAVARLSPLRAAAKDRLLARLEEGCSLRSLSRAAVEAITGRSLGAFPWEPDRLLFQAERDAGLLERLGARFIHRDAADFPALLREIPDPPFGLYCRGNLPCSTKPAVALVGTRYPTGRGLIAARKLAFEFSSAGLPIVSGLARGIDAEAHRGSLDAWRRLGGAAGQALAVLPCGIERVYPGQHRALAAAILESGGTLVSEYPPGAEIHKRNFPERNRIISGLARGVIVVEAPSGSGALITADFALEQGRDVFVAAAVMGGPRSAGSERLAVDGAPQIEAAASVLADWGFDAAALCGAGLAPADPACGEGLFAEGARLTEGLRLAAALRAELGRAPGAGG